jgi:hypothetical protein
MKKTRFLTPENGLAVMLSPKTMEVLSTTQVATGMTAQRIVAEAVESYCARKIKLAAKKTAPDEAAPQDKNERVLKVVELYQCICVPALPPVPSADVRASSRVGRAILSQPADYDWDKHFAAAMADSWLIRQRWFTFDWIVGHGFEKVRARALQPLTCRKNQSRTEGDYASGWE